MTGVTQEQFPQHPSSVFQNNTADTQFQAFQKPFKILSAFCIYLLTVESLSKVNLKLYYILLSIYHLCFSETSIPTAQNTFLLLPFIKSLSKEQHYVSTQTAPWLPSMAFYFCHSISMHFFLPSHSAAAVWIFFIFSAHLFLNVSRRVCVCLCIIQKPHRYLLSNKWIMGTIVPPLNAQRFFPINYILTIFPSSFPLWRQ